MEEEGGEGGGEEEEVGGEGFEDRRGLTIEEERKISCLYWAQELRKNRIEVGQSIAKCAVSATPGF